MWNWIEKLYELEKGVIPFVLVTVTDVKGSTPRNIGSKMIVLADGEIYGTIGGGRLEKIVIGQARVCVEEKQSLKEVYNLAAYADQCCGGTMEILFESLNNEADLIIFGGGHVGQAIADTMQGTPFKVHLLDERLASDDKLLRKDLPKNVLVYKEHWKESIKQLNFNADSTYIVILTYSHEMDEDILIEMINKDYKYLGMIGSKNKWNRFSSRLLKRGVSQTDLDQVHCPIGINIGGKAPKEVAISLASELLRIHYQLI